MGTKNKTISCNVNDFFYFIFKPSSIVSNVRYFILNNSIPLNPITIEGPRTKLLRSAGIDVHEKPVRALMKLEVTKPYVNLRQLQQIKSALVTAWIPKGSTSKFLLDFIFIREVLFVQLCNLKACIRIQ